MFAALRWVICVLPPLVAISLLPSSILAASPSQTILLTKTQEYEIGNKVLILPPGTALSVFRESSLGHHCQYGGALVWVYQKNSVTLEEAEEHFGEIVNKQPRNPDGFRGLSAVKAHKRDYRGALADLNKVMELASAPAPADHYHRGLLHRELDSFDKAMADFQSAMSLSHKSYFRVLTHHQRGLTHLDLNNIEEAIVDFDHAIRLCPKFSEAFRAKAWVMATHPTDKYRNASKAVEDATKALELSNEVTDCFYETLAVAHAEAGDFVEAIRTLNRASAQTGKKSKTQLTMIEMFQDRKPFRQPMQAGRQQLTMK